MNRPLEPNSKPDCMRMLVGVVMLSGQFGVALYAQDSLPDVIHTTLVDRQEIDAQHKRFIISRIPKLQPSESAAAWQVKANQIRDRILREVVFRGVPESWRSFEPRVVWGDVIEAEQGYRIRKLRYEALPKLWVPALLYEPRKLSGTQPVVLNVNGHASEGKSIDYKQIRCINLAKRGMIALNLEWIGMGQLRAAGWSHNHLAKLDLCGVSGLSVFFLTMSRGLDILLDHPHADPARVAVTGLSGGGWQTIMLSALDTRVRMAIPVAGYSSILQRLEHRNSIGDLEQLPSDLARVADYVHLNALMVPRPMLAIYNSRDDCCFVADTVRSNTFDPIIPFYMQAGAAAHLAYYENSEPGTHNYERDNREQLYRFLSRHFFSEVDRADDELDSENEIRSHDELHIPLPDDVVDFHSLAAELSATLPVPREGTIEQQRARLKKILRCPDYHVAADRFTGSTDVDGRAVRQLRLSVGDDWVLPALIVEGTHIDQTLILLADEGCATQFDRVRELTASGVRVIMLDPSLIGNARPSGAVHQQAMLMATVGERPLGIQVAQILAISRFLARVFSIDALDLESHGPRCSLMATVAAALDDRQLIRGLNCDPQPASLKHYLTSAAKYDETPEAYCFGLLQHFDLPQLRKLAMEKRDP